MKFGEEYFNFCKEVNNFDMNCIGDWQIEYMKMLMDVFEEHINKRRNILDYGCATGVLLETFRRHGFEKVYGCEVSRWYAENSPFIKIVDRIITPENGKLPFENNQFYFIHMSQVIEHIPEEDIPEALKEIYRLLCNGGVLYVSTVGELQPGTTDIDPTHVSLFSREKWLKLFADAGFWDVTKMYEKRLEDNAMSSKYDWVNFVLSK